MVARPDPDTFVVLPWRPQQQRVARMICDVQRRNGEPFEGDPRRVLIRQLEAAQELGYTFYVAPQIEYFYFRGPDDPTPLDAGGYFDLSPLDTASDLRRETVLTLEEMGIAVEYSHHEAAPSQHEIDLRYTDALTMADAVMTTRLVVKEIAIKQGAYATFMPKPLNDVNGSGLHVYLSLFEQERNLFSDPSSPGELSAMARSFLAGLLAYAPQFCADHESMGEQLQASGGGHGSAGLSDLVAGEPERPGADSGVSPGPSGGDAAGISGRRLRGESVSGLRAALGGRFTRGGGRSGAAAGG